MCATLLINFDCGIIIVGGVDNDFSKPADIKEKQDELSKTSADYQKQVAIIEGNLRQLQTRDSSFNLDMIDSLLSSQSLSDLFQKGSIINRLLDAKADNAAETASLAEKKLNKRLN
ncbi:hypothetical protein EFR28_08615 [Latilactobacillus curvatus]|uniref:hypothetical protein n=1 Tax=Latilactobacillus curvatus TaxID=28038 RepID=UPI0009766988|nr:hypothetical protein [Latilactobacillus curvatus]MCT3526024.1 hypothetical protein [Latilactobacillus curvatus]UTB69846.1 hypothetical protein A4W71_01290 [Latilactobacillus curvatus]UTB74916.1 hypothetical protein A4W73_08810 [Latilactobacillus curvatus]UTY80692.1 hypothetical protein A4W76_08810 [Latilactobacillus curvatus]